MSVERPIRLRSRTISTVDTPSRRGLLASSGDSPLLILQFQRGLTEPEKIAECEALGVVGRSGTLTDVLRERLDSDAYLVLKKPGANRRAKDSVLVSWVGPYLPMDRTQLSFEGHDERVIFQTIPKAALSHRPRILVLVFEQIKDEARRASLLAEWKSTFPEFDFSWADEGKGVRIDFPSRHDVLWQPVLDYFQNWEDTFWIKRTYGHYLRNYVGNSLLQSGVANTPVASMPVWNAGITGTNQVVQVVDTGVDWKNCYFGDGSVVTKEAPETHRSFTYYDVVHEVCTPSVCNCAPTANREGDNHDRTSGHGTHVAGSCCGKTSSGNSDLIKYDGVAKDAKLDFMDIQNDACDQLLIPDLASTMMTRIFQPAYNRGVRISTNSWGCQIAPEYHCVYDCFCYEDLGGWVPKSNAECISETGRRCCEKCNYYEDDEIALDQFMYDNDDSLIIFAAGNDGTAARVNTIGAPATARNVLAVGASLTSAANFQTGAGLVDIEGALNYAQEYTSGSCCTSVGECCANSNPYVRKICCEADRKQYYASYPSLFNENGVADFSAAGNVVADGRVKPDIVAPGHYVISAHSRGRSPFADGDPEFCLTDGPDGDNDAARLANSGTSMSAPLIAGAAALVRDYFSQGYGGAGVVPSDPSGALVKGALIHAARHLTGNRVVGGYIHGLPGTLLSKEQGYGLPVLTDVLRHDDYSPADYSVTFLDRQTVNFDETKLMCFTKVARDTTHEVRATIVWMDAPSSVASNVPLTNDIDLYLCGQSACWAGNGGSSLDHIHTNEQVRVPKGTLKAGEEFQIVIKGTKVDAGANVQYALIYSGMNILYTGTNCTLNENPSFAVALPPAAIGAIVGGVVGGILLLLAIAGLVVVVYLVWKKSNATPF